MNVYSYFQPISLKESDVPSKNVPLLRWSILQIKKKNLNKRQCTKLIPYIYESLQNDFDLNESEYKKILLEKIDEMDTHWLKEWIDFPMIQLVFVFILHHLYQGIIVPVLEKETIQMEVSVGWGLLIRVVGTYFLIKFLLSFFIRKYKPNTLFYWMGLVGSFIVYMAIQHISNQWDRVAWFRIPMGLWGLYCIGLWALSYYWIKREDI